MKALIISGIFSILFLVAGCTDKRPGNEDKLSINKKDAVAVNPGNNIQESIEPGNVQSRKIIIYGSKECDHCLHFIASLDSAGIKYDFRDVEKDKKLFNEMLIKIQQADIKGYVSYPVLDVEGKIMVRPVFKDLAELLK
jgi:glutaredoxin